MVSVSSNSYRRTANAYLYSVELEQSDDGNDYDSDAGAWSPRSPTHHSTTSWNTHRGNHVAVKANNARIRRDLRTAKGAGFRVAYHGSLFNGGQDGFVTISCRIAKLGISEEALQAWHLEPCQYFILLLRYTDGYRTLDQLIGSGMSHGGNGVQLKVGLGDTYKIPINEAIAAFTTLEDKSKSRKLLDSAQNTRQTKVGSLGRIFIGRPLDELMHDRLVPLLRYRVAMGFPWSGAEKLFNDHQGRNFSEKDTVNDAYWAEDSSKLAQTLPNIVIGDHLADIRKEYSFPLLAMQFALRHLVRCTEFCLVCHSKVEADFEALKPYVCSKPLCLYQYMSLGFGPSIEHEIVTQPHVVDLLISFCYTSACNQRLRHPPTGMALMVPAPALIPAYSNSSSSHRGSSGIPPLFSIPAYMAATDGLTSPKVQNTPKEARIPQTFKAKFDRPRMELLFDVGKEKVLSAGNWISFVPPAPMQPGMQLQANERWHCRVIEVLYPTARLGAPIVRSLLKAQKSEQSTPNFVSVSQRGASGQSRTNIASTITPAATPPLTASIDGRPSKLEEVDLVIYDQNFDDLDDYEKQNSICMLLDTLPSVQQMNDYLRIKGGQEMSLRTWADRISPAALGLLRWIIASNRSCIIQVDSLDDSERKSEERVAGMPGWMQFRFAQGAPDKEQRFVTSVKDTTAQQKHPTMFAWHGSPLYNWHGIVREGLHFEKADHGRAYGNGVYHSLQALTSMGYSGMHVVRSFSDEESYRAGEWPHSQLKISQAIALNEIVNAPAHFVSKAPHLVVAQLDWIQSRYLFVKCNMQGVNQLADSKPSQVYEQDPPYTPSGEKNAPIVIPMNAVSKSRRPVSKTVKTGDGKKKVKVDNVQAMEEAALVSDETETEDLTILFSDAEESGVLSTTTNKGKGKALAEPGPKKPDVSKTDFIPGSLDVKSLPLLEPPSFATPGATRGLQRELAATLKIQDTHPLHELGWYIDRELVDNVYQWIVELHSFEPHLPLAKDMKSKGVKSVVMEMRFGKTYPMSPPFVRVIRPRFLSFMQGGGGHITAGGALCMELLTNSGWSAVSNIESVLLQVRLAMSSTDPKPARLEAGPVRDYQVGEAVEAFIRACNTHGVSTSPPLPLKTIS